MGYRPSQRDAVNIANTNTSRRTGRIDGKTEPVKRPSRSATEEPSGARAPSGSKPHVEPEREKRRAGDCFVGSETVDEQRWRLQNFAADTHDEDPRED